MLTGKTRYRQGWRGKIILQVEEYIGDVAWLLTPKWRDATFIDVMSIETGEYKIFTPDLPPPKKGRPYIPQPGSNPPPEHAKPPAPPSPPKPPLFRHIIDWPIGRHGICARCKSSVIAKVLYGPMRCIHPECEYHNKPQPGLTNRYSSGGYTDEGAEIAAALRNKKSSPHKESPKNSPWWKY